MRKQGICECTNGYTNEPRILVGLPIHACAAYWTKARYNVISRVALTRKLSRFTFDVNAVLLKIRSNTQN